MLAQGNPADNRATKPCYAALDSRNWPMLLELRAENYAVIDHAIAVFGPGLNLLTGETGAGKSILVDALALLMGDKASSDVVRHGADRAVVSCVFEAPREQRTPWKPTASMPKAQKLFCAARYKQEVRAAST